MKDRSDDPSHHERMLLPRRFKWDTPECSSFVCMAFIIIIVIIIYFVLFIYFRISLCVSSVFAIVLMLKVSQTGTGLSIFVHIMRLTSEM